MNRLCWLLLLSFPLAAGAQEQAAALGFITVREILQNKCAACHDGAGSYEGLMGLNWVTAGSPEASPLYQRAADGSMPPGEPLPESETALIRDWIASGATASDTAEAALTPSKPRAANRIKTHQISGFTSGALLLGAGIAGAVQWGTFIYAGHLKREELGIEDEDQIDAACRAYIAELWANPFHQTLRWTHVGLLTAGNLAYLYNAASGIGMLTRDAPGLSPQDLHRYAFFTHGTLMIAEFILGVLTTTVLSEGSHEQMIALGAAHTAVGIAIPVVIIGSGLLINRMLR